MNTNQSSEQKQKKVKGVAKVTAVTLMCSICLSTAVSVAALSKTVRITDGENTTVINTMNLDTDYILDRAGIKLGENDKLVVNENGSNSVDVSVLRAFNVDLVADGETKTVVFNQGTVSDALGAAGVSVGENDEVTPSQSTQLTKDMKIRVDRWYTIKINDAGKKSTKEVPAGTVEEALAFLNIKLSNADKVNVKLDTEVKDNLSVKIDRVTYKTVEKAKSINYKTVEKDTSDLYVGESKVETEGVKGKKVITSRETYINGKLESTKVLSTKVTKKAVNEVVLYGTKERPQPKTSETTYETTRKNASTFSEDSENKTFTDINGETVSYKYAYTGSGTAYYASPGALTASGRPAKVGNVAVNPNVIPFGSKLYIASNDGSVVYGYATAADSGGALFDGSAIVDLYYDTYEECRDFGRRDVTVYVLSEGNGAYVG